MTEDQAEQLLLSTTNRFCCAFERIAVALEAIARAQTKAANPLSVKPPEAGAP